MKLLTEKILTEVLKNGGATINNGEIMKIDRGYMVGNGSIDILNSNVFKGIKGILKTINKLTKGKKVYGLWEDNKKIYIDNVEVITDKNTAVKVAKERKELAIWDNANGKEIKTN